MSLKWDANGTQMGFKRESNEWKWNSKECDLNERDLNGTQMGLKLDLNGTRTKLEGNMNGTRTRTTSKIGWRF